MRWRIWRRCQQLPDHSGSAAPDDARIARAEEAIARLPREVFFMHCFDDLSYERIARRLDVSVKEVETHIAATLIELRHALQDMDKRLDL